MSKVTPLRTTFRDDGWANAVTGIGKSLYDKRLWSDFAAHELTLQEAEELWAGDDMAARIVELVPDECLRQGFELQIEGDDEKATSESVMALLDEVDAIGHLREALCYARAYGGGAILLGADDGQNPARPLNLEALRSLGWMMVLSPRELEVATRYADASKPLFGEPETYRIRLPSADTASTRLAALPNVHETRLIRFSGARISRRRQIQAGGWGESVLTRCWQVVRDWQNAWQGAALLLGEVGQLVYKIKGLAELLADKRDDVVIKRAQMADQSRSICRALITDAEDELHRVDLNLGGLDTMLQQFALRLSAAARIPVTLLMGQAPAGLNATGESDIRWFYDTIAAEQKRTLLPGLNRLLTIIFRAKAGPTAGLEPDNWTVRFNPPWQLSDAEQAELRNKQAQTDSLYIREGVLTPEEVASSRFGGDAYSTDTKLDVEARQRYEAQLTAEEEMLEEATEVQTSAQAATPGVPGTTAPRRTTPATSPARRAQGPR